MIQEETVSSRVQPAWIIAAAVILIVTCAFGRLDGGVPAWELDVFRAFNDLPTAIGRPLESIMWIGTTVGIVVSALVAALLRRPTLSSQLLLGGFIAWVAQRILKPVVGRGRPAELVTDAVFHGHIASGHGIPSGHTAMVVAVCTVLAFHVRWKGKAVCVAIAAAVAIARMHTGNHLPLDIVAGAALGWLAALAGMWLIERQRTSQPTDDETASIA